MYLLAPCDMFVSNPETSSHPSSPRRFIPARSATSSTLPPTNHPVASTFMTSYDHRCMVTDYAPFPASTAAHPAQHEAQDHHDARHDARRLLHVQRAYFPDFFSHSSYCWRSLLRRSSSRSVSAWVRRSQMKCHSEFPIECTIAPGRMLFQRHRTRPIRKPNAAWRARFECASNGTCQKAKTTAP